MILLKRIVIKNNVIINSAIINSVKGNIFPNKIKKKQKKNFYDSCVPKRFKYDGNYFEQFCFIKSLSIPQCLGTCVSQIRTYEKIYDILSLSETRSRDREKSPFPSLHCCY